MNVELPHPPVLADQIPAVKFLWYKDELKSDHSATLYAE